MGQPPIPPTPSSLSLTGKTVVITGGNSGLGFEAARQFLHLGVSRLILGCRSPTKASAAVSALKADPAVQKLNPNAVIETIELDLDDYESGLRFSRQIKRDVAELDILLNNAGIGTMTFEKGKSGHERTMQVNCYTHILICLELFPLLQSTAVLRGHPTRITFVGSAIHLSQTTLQKVPLTDGVLRHLDQNFDRFRRYGDSKLAVSAYVRRLARVAPSEVVVNNLCPGMVQTPFDRDMPFVLRTIMGVVRKAWGRTVEEGARTLIYASAVAGADTNGKYLQHNEVHPGAVCLNGTAGDDFVEQLWKETVEDVAHVDPELKRFG
ncbi:hypothetical protein OQA88_6019 [Cercophora sp. LCS_1]